MREAEVLVIGAGPAGVMAAAAAAEQGRRVLLLDDNAAAGGQIWREGVAMPGEREDARRKAALGRLRESGAELLAGWRVFDAPAEGRLRAASATAAATFCYERLVLATGARERFLPFPGWTIPGVFGAGGLQALVKGGFPVEGKRVAVAGSGPLLLAVAAHLKLRGARITGVAEQAAFGRLLLFGASLMLYPAKLLEALRYRGALGAARYRTGCWPVAALGDSRLTGVRLTDGSKTWEEECELLACGFHLTPNTELAALLGCAFRQEFVEVNELQQTSIRNIYCAGEATEISGLEGALVQGEVAGLACAGRLEAARACNNRRRSTRSFARRLDAAFRLRSELRSLAVPQTIVCRCEDVTFAQLARYRTWTEAKLQARCGMGACQGRVCGPATQTIFGWKPGSVRPPLVPVPVSALCKDESTA
ncbi:MAG TPA: FAD/NAD(P)-binding oxidoreductase [Acidobacteriaceae bacterium]|nr:FAD/NAD(P)-binding oxidoreductase [Acidobacteriaceae bacterium]